SGKRPGLAAGEEVLALQAKVAQGEEELNSLKQRLAATLESFWGSSATDKGRSLRLLRPEERISVMDYKRLLDSGAPHLLLDVRPQVEVDICRLPHALHIPLKLLERRDAESLKVLGEAIREGKQGAQERASFLIYVICKLGNDSQKAVKVLQSWTDLDSLTVKDVVGGLMAWAAKIDGTFPQY
ncbi:hypothetical protein G4228_020352, partial [Cervus hanglu yarkandensis]